MDTLKENYQAASIKTADILRTIARSQLIREASRLTLPQIEAAVDLVAQMIPAGNVPGMILSGLVRLPERRPSPQLVQRDVQLLFKGVERFLDQAVYGAVFAGPAAILWGYQHLLRLAGKDPDDSFPEGLWQFYVDYALRDDTARHTNETHGFDTLLKEHHIHLSPLDRLTAWVMAAIHCLHQYDGLLENEWRERVYTHLLLDVTRNEPDAARYARLYRDWEAERPYGRGEDSAADETYPAYRRRKFDRFLEAATCELRADLRQAWLERVRFAEGRDLPPYQRQMSVLAYLDPGLYGETRTPIPLDQSQVGVIYRGHYYLIPVCMPGSHKPAEATTVRAQVAALMETRSAVGPTPLVPLSLVRRSAVLNLRSKISRSLCTELETLRLAPVLINSDQRPRQLPLAEIRQTERGVGDHALTVFDTGETIVFDQSHIFFDGAWGAALAEIVTNEALSWAVYLAALPQAAAGGALPRRLAFPIQAPDVALLDPAPRVTPEADAETEAINVKPILALRKLFKRRNDLLQLTVNDLLVLYRAIHALTYQPAPDLARALQDLARDPRARKAAMAAIAALDNTEPVNPAILIPVDASQRSPRDRLSPLSFEAPLNELDLMALHTGSIQALDAYQHRRGDRAAAYAAFDQLQRTYLATLAGFGAVLSKAKEIALSGESASIGTIRLLAHLPAPLQRMLDAVPGRFDVLNDIIKGREVFSNVGAVARGSTLTRFITAKDDNEKKTLAWGVLTDARGVMRLTLRDFRPHVTELVLAGCRDVASRLAKDYLEAYARGLNDFVRDLWRITLASRETQMAHGEKDE